MTTETLSAASPVRDDSLVWFDALGRTDVGRVGGKNASLGEMVSILGRAGEAARRLFLDAELPPHIADPIISAYRDLSRKAGKREVAVAVRSSATPEDLPDASFAGQQESFLNVVGERALLEACRRCFDSLHRPGDRLPRGQGFRPSANRAFYRHPDHGAIRLGRVGSRRPG